MTTMQSLLARLRAALNFLERHAGRALVALFGRLEWHAPGWLLWSGRHSARGWRFATANRARVASLAAALVAVGGSVWWYVTRPTPHYVKYAVTPPGLTEWDENGIKSIKPLKIVFN